MLRRRVLLHPEVIAASRNFVNVRLNIWLNERNFERLHTLIGKQYSGHLTMANTAFCLLEPDADGLSPDSFPTEASIHYGTRVGRLYPICAVPQVSYNKKKTIDFIKRRRLEDLGEEQVDPALIERILWEREHGRDGPGLAKIMNDLAANYPTKASAGESTPVIPAMPNLTQAINFGAADSRAVLAIVNASPLQQRLAPLLFEQGITGRVHTVKLTSAEWLAAQASGQIKGGQKCSGLFFLRPDSFGRYAEVQVELPSNTNQASLRRELAAALAHFRATWTKLDRKTHIKAGFAEGIAWSEWNYHSQEVAERTPWK